MRKQISRDVIAAWHKALRQSLQNKPFKILVNDGGSSDSTHKILKSLDFKRVANYLKYPQTARTKTYCLV